VADNKVLIEFQIVQKGDKISAVAKQTDKLTKSQEQNEKSQKRLSKQQEIGYGRQKQGLVQTANSTKNFSKLANTIDGGGGGTSLVGAYATLAANVFAATAAFNALSKAAEFQQLQQGLELVGNQSGRTLSVLADNLRAATDGALSLEQASRGAALGISGGFGGRELEGLATIAKGASLALGRDLADAFDRLTRGAIKLEPEILDELGIMVRLDDAVEQYAAQLGKSATSLSQLERRQAFMNAILVQGEEKFGDIADSVDPTPYQKLGATFGDLVKNIFTFINETLMLNKVVGFLAESTTALFGTMLIFGSTIAGQILPGLTNAGARAAEFAASQAEIADTTLDAAKSREALALANIKSFEGGAGNFKLVQQELEIGKKGNKARAKALKSLEASERARARNLKKFSGQARKDKELELQQIRRQIRLVKELNAAERGASVERMAASRAKIASDFAEEQAAIIQGVSTGELGLAAAITASNKAIDNKTTALDKVNKKGGKTGGILATLALLSDKLKVVFEKLFSALKAIGAAFLRFLPIIGAAVAAIGAAILAYDKFINTEKLKKFKQSNEGLEKILSKLPEKAEEFNKLQNQNLKSAQQQIKQYQIISNSIAEVNSQLQKTIELRKIADAERPGRTDGLSFGQESLLFFGGKNPVINQINEIFEGAIDTAGKSEKELKQILRQGFEIENSAEYKSYKALLESGIPDIVREVGERIDFSTLFIKDGDIRETEDILADISNGIREAQTAFNLLGDSVINFSQELRNAERVGSQFLQKFFPKTAATDIVDSFASIDKGLAGIRKAGKDAKFESTEITKSIGTALTEVGPNIRKLLGSNIRGPLEEINKLRGEIAAYGDEEVASDEAKAAIAEKRKRIEALIMGLGKDGEQVVKNTLKTLKEIQQAEILRKVTLDKIAISQKSINQAQKFSKNATELSLMFDRQKLQFKKDENDESLKILANSHNITEDTIKEVGIVNALLAKKKELVDNGGKETEIQAINLQLAERKNLVTQLDIEAATRGFKVQKAGLEIEKTRLDTLSKITEAEITISELQAKREAFNIGRATVGTFAAVKLQVEADEKRLELAKKKAKIERSILQAQAEIIKAELRVLAKSAYEEGEDEQGLNILKTLIGVDAVTELSIKALKKVAEQTEIELSDALRNAVQATFFDSPIADSVGQTGIFAGFGADQTNFMSEDGTLDKAKQTSFALNMIRNSFENFAKTIEDMFGEEGAVVSALSNLVKVMSEVSLGTIQAFNEIDEMFNAEDGIFKDMKNAETAKGLLQFAAVTQAVSGVLSGFSQVVQADAKQRVAEIDRAIEAEKKLDGKSAESQAKIAAMEKKKEAIQRKAFERNKKLQIANAIVSTASAAAQTYAALAGLNPYLAIAMAAAISALGLAQVAIIKRTQFQGGSAEEAPKQTALEIGKRGSAVDVAKGTSGGELNYIRGGQTTGSNLGGAGASFPGGAMGRRGYADGGIVVGERGPEVITPTRQIDVTPNYALGGGSSNVNFTINAVDAAGVEDVLMNQRGNIIRMIREAANENGTMFLEEIDTQAYGSSR